MNLQSFLLQYYPSLPQLSCYSPTTFSPPDATLDVNGRAIRAMSPGNRVPGYEDQVPIYPYYLRGVDEFLIQEIPAFLYIKYGQESSGFLKCALCLNEFQENEMLRILPKRGHAFHLKCIDVRLQSNSNFPLCRSTISCTNGYRFDKTLALNYLSQEDFVVIEVSGEDGTDGDQEISDSSRSHSARNLKQKMEELKKSRTYHDVSVIDVREKYGEYFSVPANIRRSLSLDSVFDARVHSSIRDVTSHDGRLNEDGSYQDSSTGSSSRRLVFSFGQGRRSRKAILPVEF